MITPTKTAWSWTALGVATLLAYAYLARDVTVTTELPHPLRGDLACLLGERYCEGGNDGFFGDEAQLKLYEARREACTWSEGNPRHHQMTFKRMSASEYVKESGMDMVWGSELVGELEFQVRYCDLPVSESELFTVLKVGPFTSRGQEWHRIQIEDTARTRSLPHRRKYTHVKESSLLAVSGDATIVDFPPLDPHHWHLNTPYGMYSVRQSEFSLPEFHLDMQKVSGHLVHQTHADSFCHTEESRFACLFLRFPEGMGHPIDENMLTFFAETNDLRSNSSAPLEYWYEISVLLGEGNFVPNRMFMFGTIPWVTPARQDTFKFMTFAIPFDKHTVHWKTHTFHECSVLSSIWFHTHHHFALDVWFFHGTPESLGLRTVPFQKTVPWQFTTLERYNMSAWDAKVHIVRAASRSHARFVCKLGAPPQRFESMPGPPAGLYPRRTRRSPCADQTFEAGSTYTLVGFFGNFAPTPTPYTNAEVLMHHDILGYQRPCAASER